MEAWLLRALKLGKRARIADWPGAVTIPADLTDSPALWEALERMAKEGRSFRYERPSPFGPAVLWVASVPRSERPLCGAGTRKGTPCRARAVEGRDRCRMHGGLSTGPKTAEGRARIAESNRRRAERRKLIGPSV